MGFAPCNNKYKMEDKIAPYLQGNAINEFVGWHFSEYLILQERLQSSEFDADTNININVESIIYKKYTS